MTLILTQEQHDRWVHWCGKTGEELDEDVVHNKSECRGCLRRLACGLDHSIRG